MESLDSTEGATQTVETVRNFNGGRFCADRSQVRPRRVVRWRAEKTETLADELRYTPRDLPDRAVGSTP